MNWSKSIGNGVPSMRQPRETQFGTYRLHPPLLFASYRLGDVTGAGLRFFPWDITGVEALLINAYDFTRPKFRRLLEAGWNLQAHLRSGARPVMVDSGAYYFIRKARIDITPEAVLHIQWASGADVAVVLDHPFLPEAPDRAERIQRTLANTERAFAYCKEIAPTVSLMPVVHGATEEELQYCVASILRLAERYKVQLQCIGVGSLAPLARRGGGRHAVRVISTVRRLLPADIHLHCFSMGSALNMLLAFAAGADSVDSQSWIVSAGLKLAQLPGRYVWRAAPREYPTPEAFNRALEGFVNHLWRLVNEEGFGVRHWDTGEAFPLDSMSACRAYAEMLIDPQGNAHVHWRACHNLWVYAYEARATRAAIHADCLEAFLQRRLCGTRYYAALKEVLK
ncbi:MAG: queuine tRNA-ribosyltransferase family protein [Fimbriimonadales bacterium]|nr:queuine tRNA-ribosyltransferase family protein [Fimbriimonadales bacterium]